MTTNSALTATANPSRGREASGPRAGRGELLAESARLPKAIPAAIAAATACLPG